MQRVAFAILAGNRDISLAGTIMVDGHDVGLNYVVYSLAFTYGLYMINNAGDLFSAGGA